VSSPTSADVSHVRGWVRPAPVGGTSCPPRRRWVEMRLSGGWSQRPRYGPSHGWWWESLPCPELGWRRSPSLSSSPPRARACAAVTRVAGLLSHRLACSAIAMPPARRKVVEYGLALVSPLMSALSLEREVSVRPRRHRPRWNRHHGLSGRRVPRIVPSRRGEVGAPFSARSHVELLGGVPYHGPQWGWWPAAG
jgi:hypothetical protein